MSTARGRVGGCANMYSLHVIRHDQTAISCGGSVLPQTLQHMGRALESVPPAQPPERLIKNNVGVHSNLERNCSCDIMMQGLDKLNKHDIGPWLPGWLAVSGVTGCFSKSLYQAFIF